MEFCRNAFDSVELLVETIHVHCISCVYDVCCKLLYHHTTPHTCGVPCKCAVSENVSADKNPKKRKEKKWRAERNDTNAKKKKKRRREGNRWSERERERNADVYDIAIIPLPNNKAKHTANAYIFFQELLDNVSYRWFSIWLDECSLSQTRIIWRSNDDKKTACAKIEREKNELKRNNNVKIAFE